MDTSCTQSAQSCVIVGSEFCTPRPMDLVFITQAPGLKDGEVMATDEDGNVVFTAEGSSGSLRGRKVLLNAHRSPVISVQEKLISGHGRWQAFMGDSSSGKDKLFSVKKARAFGSRTELEVFLAQTKPEKVCDFKIKGSYDRRTCAIYQGDSSTAVAQMNTRYRVANMPQGKHLFSMHINPNIDYCFIAAIAVILHGMGDEESTDILGAIVEESIDILGAIVEVAQAVTAVAEAGSSP